jgi:hypothetical protein
MNNKNIFFNKKPEKNCENKQLFSFDVASTGAKNFLFDTYENIYKYIINNQISNYYEDNTFSTKIKLFVDIDEKIIFTTTLERDKYANNLLSIIINNINVQLYKLFQINNPKIIILISDTLQKLSLHLIYPEIIFNNIYEMKYVMTDIELIDHSVYKIGCFRMLYCSKYGKNNKLIYLRGINYNNPNDDYKLFLDCCICYSNNIVNIEKINIPEIITTKYNKKINIITKLKDRNYIYKNIDLEKIKLSLNKLSNYSNDYLKWLIISFCLKDLYLSCYPKEYQKNIYNLFVDFSKISNLYNKKQNKNIFMNLEPKIDINYLFKLSDDNLYIPPFYNYKEIIFNPNNHHNIIIKNETYINLNTDLLLNHKYIFIKSPTGTGKTTYLKKLIDIMNINNIISITSRVNLAGEHLKHLNLQFYSNLHYNEFGSCNKLVIQLESLIKCNYNLYKNGIVILDEINSLLSHLRSPTLNKRRKEVYMYLIELIQNAKYVISLDADLSDWNINFLQEISELHSENSSWQKIKKIDYIIYYNTIKNKNNINSTFYICPQIMIDNMVTQIKGNKYFISCFDSLKQMNKIIEYLSQFGNKKEWLIYSSEINYGLIDTSTWIDKFVFYSPSIIYGIDYNYKNIDVYCFIYKNHLNPLQIYQMISRARKQNIVNVYCKEKIFYIKYKSVDDVIKETELYEKNFGYILPTYNNYIDIDDKPYRIMYYNYKYLDSILKTNIKNYLIDIMKDKGYIISYNNCIKNDSIDKKELNKFKIKEKIIQLLSLDNNNLSDFEKKLVSNDIFLEKHFNLRLFLNDNIDYKIINSIETNLFIETLNNKYTKIKIGKELMTILNIYKLEELTKDITKNFNNIITNNWLDENLNIIKKTFDIRTKKYNNTTYYNIYLLLITILKNLFDNNLFIKKECQIKKIKFYYYIFNNDIFNKHKLLINK